MLLHPITTVSMEADALVRDRHRELRAPAAARHRSTHVVSPHPAVRAWFGWMLVRTGWRLASSGRRADITICGRTTL
jgi:hypothetical protein